VDGASLLLGVAVGAAAGAVAGWFIALARAQRRLAEVTAALGTEASSLAAQVARLEEQVAAERRAAEEKARVLTDTEGRFREAFQALSADALRASGEQFLRLAETKLGAFHSGARQDLEARQKAIDDLLRPVRDGLAKVDATLQGMEKDRAGAYSALEQQVRSLATTQVELRAETSNLVRALRAPQVRGRWGEIQLRRVVEMAGMLDHCDFHEQRTADGDDGPLRPDLVVHLPGGKNVVVDAKTPLEAYLQSLEAKDDVTREAALREHARQVRDHVVALSRKAYWEQFQPSPEFVVMFLPGETFFSAALQHDPSLIEAGVAQRVLPASPTTLIALLRAVAYGWQQERISEKAAEIHALGRQLHERIATVGEHFVRVGRGLEGAVNAYNDAVRSLETRVLVSARKLEELDAGSAKAVPELPVVDTVPRALQAPELKD